MVKELMSEIERNGAHLSEKDAEFMANLRRCLGVKGYRTTLGHVEILKEILNRQNKPKLFGKKKKFKEE